MDFDTLDKKMRVFEKSVDQVIPTDTFLVARLDGKSFSRLTKEICDFEVPFDERFRDMMVHTVKTLMCSGYRVVYGYTESDEISLLFHNKEEAFGRKVRKYNSILAGIASAAFSLELGQIAVFDCRIVPLPDIQSVKDYFRWRGEDAYRNALNAHSYWLLRKNGMGAAEATEAIKGKSTEFKKELLLSHGIDFEKLPSWQKHGIGIYWENFEKVGFNPITKNEQKAVRRELVVNFDLPCGEEYGEFVISFLEK